MSLNCEHSTYGCWVITMHIHYISDPFFFSFLYIFLIEKYKCCLWCIVMLVICNFLIMSIWLCAWFSQCTVINTHCMNTLLTHSYMFKYLHILHFYLSTLLLLCISATLATPLINNMDTAVNAALINSVDQNSFERTCSLWSPQCTVTTWFNHIMFSKDSIVQCVTALTEQIKTPKPTIK